MRGTGFKCDQCKAETVQSPGPLVIGVSALPPEGWIVLTEREHNPFGTDWATNTHEFCSWPCLSAFGVSRVADELEASA